jgi:8-oxo-dGTP pyrophosphatase MutT (NUDIX family)
LPLDSWRFPLYDTSMSVSLPAVPDVFSPRAFRDRVRAVLGPMTLEKTVGAEAVGSSDFDLNPELAAPRTRADAIRAARPAAVLIPAIARPALTLLFTQRTEHLSAHAGQIAFPGGKAEPSDATPVATALREAREEIGLDPAAVEPLGTLDCYLTGTGYCITPVIGLVSPDASLVLDRNEVADTFEVPLTFLMDGANYQRHTRKIGDTDRVFYAVPFAGRFIWGATAGILNHMRLRLFE